LEHSWLSAHAFAFTLVAPFGASDEAFHHRACAFVRRTERCLCARTAGAAGERIDVQGPAGVLRGSLLTPESGAGTNLAAYGNANVPLAPGIAERIAAFVTEQGVPE
jgi:hypothetical protein